MGEQLRSFIKSHASQVRPILLAQLKMSSLECILATGYRKPTLPSFMRGLLASLSKAARSGSNQLAVQGCENDKNSSTTLGIFVDTAGNFPLYFMPSSHGIMVDAFKTQARLSYRI